MPRLLAIVSALLVLRAASAAAGSFVFADGTNGVDLITHPTGYSGSGGTVTVDICIDPSSANKNSMVVPLQNAVSIWNTPRHVTKNLLAGNQNDVPGGNVDFESVLLHEVGHCVGLAHPNLGTESGLTGGATNYTRSTTGANLIYDKGGGVDTIIGSSDDVRGDDVNLHWFRKTNNDPFTLASTVDTSTYSRDLADLPGGHLFPANAGRAVALLLGVTGTEAVMQQGTGIDESQRLLAGDDVATLELGMSGGDETEATSDDYTLVLNYDGIKNGCDIMVDFDNAQTGLAICIVSGSIFATNHVEITDANIYFNTGWSWYYNASLGVCGNEVLEGSEACDDGGVVTDDGCDTLCAIETGWNCSGTPSSCSEICGDSLIVGSETCDDGGTSPGDGCDASCQEESGWSCSGEPSTCSEVCGDGIVTASETCDDGGTSPGDGCDGSCQEESGWSCSGEPSTCSEVCGDGLITGAEGCDDGGTSPGDGCDGSCSVESGWMCSGEPSNCSVLASAPGLGPIGRGGLVAVLLAAALWAAQVSRSRGRVDA